MTEEDSVGVLETTMGFSGRAKVWSLRSEMRGLEEHEVGRLRRLVGEGLVEARSSAVAWDFWCRFIVFEALGRWEELLEGVEEVLEAAPVGERWRRLEMVCEGMRLEKNRSYRAKTLSRLAVKGCEAWIREAALEIETEASLRSFLDAWTRLPRLAANALEAKSPIVEADWRLRSCRAVIHSCRRQGGEKALIFFSAFASQCKLLNCCHFLARAWADGSFEEEVFEEQSIDAKVFGSLSGSALDAMAEALTSLGALEGGERWGSFLDATVGSRSPSHLRPFLKRLACGRCCLGSPRAAAYCVRFAKNDAQTFEDVVSAAISLWIDADFVRDADEQRRDFVTIVVLYALRTAAQDHIKSDNLVAAVVPGVSSHLESVREQDRAHAMIVAEAFAALVNEKLHFDDLHDEYRQRAHVFFKDLGLPKDFLQKQGLFIDDNDNDDSQSGLVLSERDEKKKKALEDADNFDRLEKRAFQEAEANNRQRRMELKKKKAARRPDDAVVSESESESESGSEDDDDDDDDDVDKDDDNESLEAYDLSDDGEDLAAVPKPRYLREIVGLFETKREKEDARDRHLVALDCAEELIRARPKDLRDVAVTLAKCLLHLGNNFNIEHFEKRCRNTLVALVALEPKQVCAPYLIPAFIDGEQTVSKRIEILDCLAAAAKELSFGMERAIAMDPGRMEDDDEENSKILVEGPSSATRTDLRVEQRVQGRRSRETSENGGRTRRWGYRRNPLEKSLPNLFGALAARNFFFPLLYVYLSDKGARVRERSSFKNLLLCNLLNTLSVFTDCAATTPAAPAFATHLLAFAWSKANDPDPAIRKCVCVATVTALTSVPDGLHLLQRHAGTLGLPPAQDIYAFAQKASTADPDPTVRAITTNIARALDPRGTLLM